MAVQDVRTMAAQVAASVEARLVSARRASNVGRRVRGPVGLSGAAASSLSGVKSDVRGRMADEREGDDVVNAWDGLTEISILAVACAAV